MRVCVVCHDLSSGAALTALAACDALAGHHEVRLVGPQFDVNLWPALSSTRYSIDTVRATRSPGFLLKIPRLVARLQADVVVCCKVRFPSVFVAMVNKVIRGIPVVLFVDDDERALTAPGRSLSLRRRLADPGGDLYTALAHRLSRYSKAVVSSASSMQRVYGGTTLPLGRDLTEFDPARFDRNTARARLGLALDTFIVGFIGVPRDHKGFDDLLVAVDMAGITDLCLMVVPPKGFSDAKLRESLAHRYPRVILIEDQPSARVPEFLAACDAVAIPQRSTPEAEAQLPAKLLEAMSMGKAIVATRVSDMPGHLHGCGLIIAPSSPEQLAVALERLRRDAALRTELGRRAREAYARHLSNEVLSQSFRQIVETAARRRH